MKVNINWPEKEGMVLLLETVYFEIKVSQKPIALRWQHQPSATILGEQNKIVHSSDKPN